MRNIVIVQARMGSARLAGKVLLPLGDALVLDYVTTRCRAVADVTEVVVATSTREGDDAIERFCSERRVACFRGSEHDVLSRFFECAVAHRADTVMRVTADCPFLHYEQASEMVRAMNSTPVDVVRLRGEQPRGLPAEIVSFSALARMHSVGREPRHREHVTYYATEHPDEFSTAWVQLRPELAHPELRITLDTHEDYALLRAVAAAFLGNLLVSSDEVVRYLVAHPEIAALNASVAQKPVV